MSYDMTQMLPNETIDDYHSRPLFPLPTFSKIISHHTGTVLEKDDPHVHLNQKEEDDFTREFQAFADKDSNLPYVKFPDLLKKLNISLSKTLYNDLIDAKLSHFKIDPNLPLTLQQANMIYVHVYAPSIKFGPRMRAASGRGDGDIVSSLAMRGCDLNTADGNGHTSLHHACFYDQFEMIKLLVNFKDTNVKVMIDAKDNRGWSPLMCAASNGFVDSVKLLVECHAKIDACNLEGRNALHIAAGKGMTAVVKLLMASQGGGSLINVKSTRGWTPLFDACLHQHEDVIKVLVREKADVKVEDMLGYTCGHYLTDEEAWERSTEPKASPRGKSPKGKGGK